MAKYVFSQMDTNDYGYPYSNAYDSLSEIKEKAVDSFINFLEEKGVEVDASLFESNTIDFTNEDDYFEYDESNNKLEFYAENESGNYSGVVNINEKDLAYVCIQSDGIRINGVSFYDTFMNGFDQEVLPEFEFENAIEDEDLELMKTEEVVDIEKDSDDAIFTLTYNSKTGNGDFEGSNLIQNVDIVLTSL